MVGVPKKANDQIFYKNVNMNPNINTFKNIHANSKSVSFPNKKIINNFLTETNSINGNNLYSKNINDDIDEQLYTEKILKDNPDNRKHIDLTKSKLMSDIDYNQKYPHNTIKYGEKKDNKKFLEYEGDIRDITFRNDDKKNIEVNNSKQNNNSSCERLVNKNSKYEISGYSTQINNKPIQKEIIEIIKPKYIKSVKPEQSKLLNYNKFCDGFFICGLTKPLIKEKIIKDSKDFSPTCGHKTCNLLPSIQPEILYFYKNDNLNLSNDKIKSLPKLSFPLGIKICIENEFDSKKVKNFPQQIFFNIVKDDKGETLYICTCYQFTKVYFEGFIQKYECDISFVYSELFKNVKKNTSINSFYVLESINLISRYPFFNSMNICLNAFLSPFVEDRINLLNHMINEIPIPNENSQIKFFTLLFRNPVILNHERNFYKLLSIKSIQKQICLLHDNYLSTNGLDFKLLFEFIPLDHIIFIFSMILLEQKILLVYEDYEILSTLIFIFISLLFPFSWKNNIIPIISLDTINLLMNETHFIAGIDETLFSHINKNGIKLGNDVIIYNISSKNFISRKNIKKTTKNNLLREHKLFTLPQKIIDFLMGELGKIIEEININIYLYDKLIKEETLENYNKLTYFKQHIEYETKLIFIKSIIMLIGNFEYYTFFSEEKSWFNREAFVESYKEKDFQNYLNLFVNTNLFNDFLDEQKKLYLSKNSNNIDTYPTVEIISDVYYFNKILYNYQDLKYNYIIMDTSFNLSKILTKDIQEEVHILCKKLYLINDNIIASKLESELPTKKLDNHKNKKNQNNLFSHKKFLEDINENINKNSDDYKNSNYNKMINNTQNPVEKKNNDKILYTDMNSQNNKNKSFIKKYLLSPYFLPNNSDDDFYFKEYKDENIILKEIQIYRNKNNIKESLAPCISILYRNLKLFNYNSDKFKKDKVYIICNDESNKNMGNSKKYKIYKVNNNKFKNELNLFKNPYYKDKTKENEIIDLKGLFRINDKILLINKLFKYFFEQKIDFKDEYLKNIKRIFANIDNIEYFSNLIVPHTLLNEKTNQKQLTANSFNSFSKIIKIAFENININNSNIGRLLTLACFIYFKIEQDKVIYLYSDFLINKLDKTSQPYQLWNNKSFWIEFFHFEYEFNLNKMEKWNNNEDDSESENKSDNDINNPDSFGINKKICLINSIFILCNIMLKLELSKNFVRNIIEKMILPIFINDMYFINRIMNLVLSSNQNN